VRHRAAKAIGKRIIFTLTVMKKEKTILNVSFRQLSVRFVKKLIHDAYVARPNVRSPTG